MRPSRRAVGSPSRSAVNAWAISWMVSENRSTMKEMKTAAKSISGKESRLRPTREKRKDGIRHFRADNRRQLLARRAAHARQTAERRQQHLSPPDADAGHVIELASQIAHRARAPVERDGEAMRLVADALHEQQRRVVRRQRHRLLVIAREEQLFLFRDADRHEIREPELLERRVRRRQLTLAAVYHDQIGEGTAMLEECSVPAQNDFLHRREVVLRRAEGFGIRDSIG